MNSELLKYVVEASKVNASEKYPLGYCYLEHGHTDAATALHAAGLIEANINSRANDNSFPVRPTEAGVKLSMEKANNPAPLQPQPKGPVMSAVETGIPIPAKKAFGRTSDGHDKVTSFGFDNWEVNQSVFIAQPPGQEVPIHRSFSSVVSQANKKLWPKNFVIREWEGGARVWRVEDLKEARPTRSPRKVKQEAQPTTQPGAQFPGGFAAPGHPGFGASPMQAPQPFAPQPFMQAPQGFGPAPGQEAVEWSENEPGLPDFPA